MANFEICQLLATPGLFEYFWQNWMSSENQFFLDEGVTRLQGGLGVLGGQVPRLYGGAILGEGVTHLWVWRGIEKKGSVLSHAVSTSGATYLVTMACVCLVVWLFVSHRPPTPGNHRISKIPKPNLFQLILSNFPGDPPPTKGKNFWHQIWLDTCSDWKKKNFQKNFWQNFFFAKFFSKNFLRPFHRISWTIS